MNSKPFYDAIRPSLFGGQLSQGQVEGIDAILEEGADLFVPQLAYVLATSYWETGQKMQPVREVGKGRGKAYGKPVPPYNQIYYGRGDVQLTWLANYRNAQKQLNIFLVQSPDLALENKISKRILVRGMIEGWFAGDKNGRHTLSRWINNTRKDFKGARRIVNGVDKADQIASIAMKFDSALFAADWQKQRNEYWRDASGIALNETPILIDKSISVLPANDKPPLAPPNMPPELDSVPEPARPKSIAWGRIAAFFITVAMAVAIWKGL